MRAEKSGKGRGGPGVAIVDFGLGNLFSVKRACEQVGMSAEITGDKGRIASAAALILLSQHNPGREVEFARLMRRRGAHIQPNRLMIALADELLDRGGRLIAATEAMGPADPFSPWRLVSLPARMP